MARKSNQDELKSSPNAIAVLDVPVHSVTVDDVKALAAHYLSEPRLHQIATVNPEFIMAAQKDSAFMDVLRRADLCLADGVGVVWASRWLRNPLLARVPGSELIFHLAELAAVHGWRLFLLGAGPGVAEEAAELLQERYPGLVVAGTYAGSPDLSENAEIVQRINDSGANLLYVAYGAPAQDKWIARNRTSLTGVRLAMGVGGSLDFVTGRSTRAPRWLQRLGLEWLHRLIKEPWRWRRMLALPRFALRVLLSSR